MFGQIARDVQARAISSICWQVSRPGERMSRAHTGSIVIELTLSLARAIGEVL